MNGPLKMVFARVAVFIIVLSIIVFNMEHNCPSGYVFSEGQCVKEISINQKEK